MEAVRKLGKHPRIVVALQGADGRGQSIPGNQPAREIHAALQGRLRDVSGSAAGGLLPLASRMGGLHPPRARRAGTAAGASGAISRASLRQRRAVFPGPARRNRRGLRRRARFLHQARGAVSELLLRHPGARAHGAAEDCGGRFVGEDGPVSAAYRVSAAQAAAVPSQPDAETSLRIARARLLESAGLPDLAQAELRFGARNGGQPYLLAMELARTASTPHERLHNIKSAAPDYLAMSSGRRAAGILATAVPAALRKGSGAQRQAAEPGSLYGGGADPAGIRIRPAGALRQTRLWPDAGGAGHRARAGAPRRRADVSATVPCSSPPST